MIKTLAAIVAFCQLSYGQTPYIPAVTSQPVPPVVVPPVAAVPPVTVPPVVVVPTVPVPPEPIQPIQPVIPAVTIPTEIPVIPAVTQPEIPPLPAVPTQTETPLVPITPPIVPPIPFVPIPTNPANPVPPVPVPPVPTQPVIPAIPAVTSQPGPAIPTNPALPLPATTASSGYLHGYYGQLCAEPLVDAQCQAVGQQISNTEFIKCEKDYDCCLCGSVSCNDCGTFTVGNSGLFGVQYVDIQGRDPESGGALVGCKGVEACQDAVINGANIRGLDCSGAAGCKGATIRVYSPVEHFYLDCIAMGSCQDLSVELIIPPGYTTPFGSKLSISRIACSGQASCENLSFKIINDANFPVEIENVDCLQHDACTNAVFDFGSNVQIDQCECGQSCQSVTGIDACFENLQAAFCPDPISCRGAVRTIFNPMQGFILKCASSNSCQGAQFTINLDSMGSNPSMLDGIMCNGPNACDGATFTINNEMATALEIEKMECSAPQACKDATFITGTNVDFGDIYCNPDACQGCTVTTAVGVPGVPCDVSNIGLLPGPGIVTLPPLPPQSPPQEPPQVPTQTLPPYVVAV